MTDTKPNQLKPLLTIDEVEALADRLVIVKRAGLEIIAELRDRAGVDQRWLSIGMTDFEKGLMFIGKELVEGPLNQAIADDEG